MRDLQEQLAKSEEDAVTLRRELEKAKASTKTVQENADRKSSNQSAEISKLRQLIVELKDALHQSVQVNNYPDQRYT